MVDPGTDSPLAALGFDEDAQRAYGVVLRNPGSSAEEVSWMSGVRRERLADVVEGLCNEGLVRVESDRIVPLPPEDALARLITTRNATLRAERERLDDARRRLHDFVSANHRAPESAEAISIEVLRGRDLVGLLPELAQSAPGPMAFLRPDQWRFDDGARTDEVVRALIKDGRGSRVIYPARALEEAPGVVRARAEVGEQVRFLASVPTRMALFGTTLAMLPTRFGTDAERVLVIRQEALVAACLDYFEGMWERALSMPGLDASDRAGDRRLFLQQLASGAKDEQIARTLGLSLRTVRRRVADLMDQLGAESRFQAGAEAVRRGWL